MPENTGARNRVSAAIAPFRFHDLRHTHVSWLIAGGLPLPNIQARLGHESITTTIDTYGHLMPVGNELASQIIDTALRGEEIHPAPAMKLIPGGKAAAQSESLVPSGADTGEVVGSVDSPVIRPKLGA